MRIWLLPNRIKLLKFLSNNCFSAKNPYDKESERYKKLDEPVLNFIINSCQPLSIVDEENIVKILATFDDRYKLKCRQTLTKTDIPKKLESAKIKLKIVFFWLFLIYLMLFLSYFLVI